MALKSKDVDAVFYLLAYVSLTNPYEGNLSLLRPDTVSL